MSLLRLVTKIFAKRFREKDFDALAYYLEETARSFATTLRDLTKNPRERPARTLATAKRTFAGGPTVCLLWLRHNFTSKKCVRTLERGPTRSPSGSPEGATAPRHTRTLATKIFTKTFRCGNFREKVLMTT